MLQDFQVVPGHSCVAQLVPQVPPRASIFLGKKTVQPNLFTLDDVSRLLRLVVAVAEEGQCTLSHAIDRITEYHSPRQTDQTDRTALAEFAALWRQVRVKRDAIFGARIFRDPGYDMLLESFAADQRRQQLSITSLCYASGVPMTTALRYIDKLEVHGLILRSP